MREEPTFSSMYPEILKGKLKVAADFQTYAEQFVSNGAESDPEDVRRRPDQDVPSWAVLQFRTVPKDGSKWPWLPKKPRSSTPGLLTALKHLIRAYIQWLWGKSIHHNTYK